MVVGTKHKADDEHHESKMRAVLKRSSIRRYVRQDRRNRILFLNKILIIIGILVSTISFLPLHDRSLELVPEERTFGFSVKAIKNATVTPSTKQGPLKIAWLMSYPNSGTSYTLELVRVLTRTFVASNYHGRDAKNISRLPIFNHTASPFWVHHKISNATYPKHYALTKTHCGVQNMKRTPMSYLESTYSFRKECLTATLRKGKWIYNESHVAKAIHLIRNPFDNIVARFHLDRKQESEQYSKTREGFRNYCSMLDAQHSSEEKSIAFLRGALALLKNVPCRSDFVRYIEWHNMAFITTHDLDLDTYVLYYDWYETRFDETVSELLEFLHLERRGKIRPFVPGKVYRDYFTEEERRAVQVAFQSLATKTTWRHIERYFDYL